MTVAEAALLALTGLVCWLVGVLTCEWLTTKYRRATEQLMAAQRYYLCKSLDSAGLPRPDMPGYRKEDIP